MNALLLCSPGAEVEPLVSEFKSKSVNCRVLTEIDVLLPAVAEHNPDLLLLRVPRSMELEIICRDLKHGRKMTIITMTETDKSADIIAGTDDIVFPPYRADEIIARWVYLRRKKLSPEDGKKIVAGELCIDVQRYEVYEEGIPVDLTYREYELLKFLATNPGKVFSRDTLLNRVWGEDYIGGDRTVDVHIRRLRSKLEERGRCYIDTVRSIGYRFNAVP